MQSELMIDALRNDAEQGDGADTPVTSSLQSRVVGGVLLIYSLAVYTPARYFVRLYVQRHFDLGFVHCQPLRPQVATAT